jgi:hypothetical protein
MATSMEPLNDTTPELAEKPSRAILLVGAVMVIVTSASALYFSYLVSSLIIETIGQNKILPVLGLKHILIPFIAALLASPLFVWGTYKTIRFECSILKSVAASLVVFVCSLIMLYLIGELGFMPEMYYTPLRDPM